MNLIRRILRRQEGSMAVEAVLIVPALAIIIGFLIACGRIAFTQQTVQEVANAAARDASLSRSVAGAQDTANANALNAAAQAGLKCQPITVAIDGSGIDAPLGTVGTVSATVSCKLNLSDIALPGLPGTKTFTTTSTSPVDPYRERQ